MQKEETYREWLVGMGIRDTWDYDYYSAWKAGERPDSTGHWTSKYKHDLSSERYIKTEEGWWDTKQTAIRSKMIYVPFEKVLLQRLLRQEVNPNIIEGK